MTIRHLFVSPLLLSSMLHAEVLLSSAFDGNSGATIISAKTATDEGSKKLTITDWQKHPAVGKISNLTLAGSHSGGFQQLLNGKAPFANKDVVFISKNHKDSNKGVRGFGFNFTLTEPCTLGELIVRSMHTNEEASHPQKWQSDLVVKLSGNGLSSPLKDSQRVDYTKLRSDYADITLTGLVGQQLAAGTYRLRITQENFTEGKGGFASFDGLTLHSSSPGQVVQVAKKKNRKLVRPVSSVSSAASVSSQPEPAAISQNPTPVAAAPTTSTLIGIGSISINLQER